MFKRKNHPLKGNNGRRITRYLIIAVLPLALCWVLVTRQSHRWTVNISRMNAQNMLSKNLELINKRFEGIERSMYALTNDSSFNELLASASNVQPWEYYEIDRQISDRISQYFWDYDSFCSVYIVSDRFSRSYVDATAMPSIIYPDNLVEIGDIRARGTAATWFPTRRYSDVVHISDRYEQYYSNFDVLSVGMQMDYSYVERKYLHSIEGVDDYPVLMINLYSSIFDQWLSQNRLLSNSSYCVYTPDRQLIYCSEDVDWASLSDEMRPIPGFEIESSMLEMNGQEMLLYSGSLERTGWIVTSYTPIEAASLYFGNSINLITLVLIVLTITLVFIVVHVTTKGITVPLSILCTALDETATGNYAHRIHNERFPDYRSTFNAYNSMNDHIERLIAENYEARISEKELEIQTLNMQFNPHFLYNILNTISLMALERGQEDVSEMLSRLSYMMRYSTRTDQPFVSVRDELHYIDSYVSTMQLRTNGTFTYSTDVDPLLLDHSIPRFLLQPFVENAILHGFSAMDANEHYELKLIAVREGDDIVFMVRDNGKGMEERAIETLWAQKSAGIGIANTNTRIQLYYGKAYGVHIDSHPNSGTSVLIRIPFEKAHAAP